MEFSICKKSNMCTGCTACVSVCPKECIQMIQGEGGFLYPQIDMDKCIRCGLCEKTCPVNIMPKTSQVKKGYIARSKDGENLDNSTSGGMCFSLAEFAFSNDGGVIYGAGYNEEMEVYHFGIDSSQKKRLREMRGSKYVQSSIGGCFLEIKEHLERQKSVCFVGTPCQVAGLVSYLKKDYENLLTVDLVCHGVSSPLIFKEYINSMSKRFQSKIKEVRFRNKTYGYHSGTMRIDFENGKKYYGSGRIDVMLKAYFSGACSRKSCYQCPFKSDERCSDITIFDSWHVEKLVPEIKDDDKGFTNVFIHTDKGMKAWEKIKNNLHYWEADPLLMKRYDGIMIDNNPAEFPYRKELCEAVEQEGFDIAMKKYLPVTGKDIVIEKVKSLLYRLGILRLIKRK